MNSLHKLTLATLIIATPSLALAQGKASHPAPPVVMGKSGPVRQDDRPDKIADKAEREADRTADKEAARKADMLADKAERKADRAADKEAARKADMLADKAARKADRTADQTARNADKIADKSAHKAGKAADKAERLTDKTDRSELRFAYEQKLLTKGIRLTSAEKKQLKSIEKKYDKSYRDLRQKELAADKAAKKTGTAESDATFQSQLSQLQAQERVDMRAVLTTQQQSIFDSNVSKQATSK